MPTTLATRKPVEDLSAADLEVFPVWEFATNDEGVEGQDETWIKPVDTLAIPSGSFAVSMAAVMKLANEQVFPGVLFGDAANALDVSAIALLTTQGRILFSAYESRQAADACLAGFGLSVDQVFPIAYCTRAPLESTSQLARGEFAPAWS